MNFESSFCIPRVPAINCDFQGLVGSSDSANILISLPVSSVVTDARSILTLPASIFKALILSAVTTVSAPACKEPPIANAANTVATIVLFLPLVLVANSDATT